MHSLSRGHAVITGAASGRDHYRTLATNRYHMLILGIDTGFAIALVFASSGCESIFLGDLSTEKLQECRDSIEVEYPAVKVYFKALDRSSESDVDAFYEEVTKTVERIDISVDVVSTQGQDTSNTRGLSIEKYDQCFSVSQKGVSRNSSEPCFQQKSNVCPRSGISHTTRRASADVETRNSPRDRLSR